MCAPLCKPFYATGKCECKANRTASTTDVIPSFLEKVSADERSKATKEMAMVGLAFHHSISHPNRPLVGNGRAHCFIRSIVVGNKTARFSGIRLLANSSAFVCEVR
jgi:hypothetical protein